MIGRVPDLRAFVARWSWTFQGGYRKPSAASYGPLDATLLARGGDQAALRELRFLFGQVSDEDYDKAVAAVRAEWEKPLPVLLRARLAYLVPTEQDLAESLKVCDLSLKGAGWVFTLCWVTRNPTRLLRCLSGYSRTAFLCSGPEEALIEALEDCPSALALQELACFGVPMVANHYLGLDENRRRSYFLRFPELGLELLPKDDALRDAILRAHPALKIAHVAAKGRGGIKRAAAGWLQSLAKQRGLSKDQLADRLVPDLGLDSSGSLVLDLGPRSFQVGFDEQLKPWVRGEDGKKRASLPKSKSDDEEKSELAQARWSALKKDVRTLASVQLTRFEQAMVQGREWTMAEFQQHLVAHPLLRHVVQRLLWKSGELVFRVDEVGQPVDVQDDELTFGTELLETNAVRLVHRLELSPQELAAWGERLADYEILQPFDQLQRETFVFGAPSAKAVVEQIEGAKAKGGSVTGLQNHGWMRGPVEDGGQWYTLIYQAGDLRMTLTMDHGVNIQGGYGMDLRGLLDIPCENRDSHSAGGRRSHRVADRADIQRLRAPTYPGFFLALLASDFRSPFVAPHPSTSA